MRRTVKEEAAVEHAGTDARDGAPGDACEEAAGVGADAAGDAREQAAGAGADATGDARQQAAGARARAAGDAREDDTLAAIESQSRRLRNSIVSLAVFFVLLVGLLAGVPGLRSAAERITDAKPAWVVAGVACEVLSCVGYMVLFDLVFSKIGRRLGSRLSLAELAMNSVVSISGLAGIALGAWVLRSKGFSMERIAKRSVLIFVLTSAVNVAAVFLIGVPMWLGLLPGSRRALITLVPAIAALATIAGTLALAAWAGRAASRQRLEKGRAGVAVTALSGGVADALRLIRGHDWRLLGAVAYWLLDNLVLYACVASFGHGPSFWAVAMAYLVGMLANSLPIPGGFVVVEGGLVGMLLLFGLRPASQVLAAVVIYRAISLWVPALIGSAAFLSLRREIGKPVASSVAR
ncbi:MAG TPA: YbhN family protein [Solirubrobacteraceae bacterium]|nr:YbhN family protein [Solirubrobacteraceae bacterium]